MALLIRTGTAAPTVTPDFIGQQFIDTVANITYIATGLTSGDWQAGGGGGSGGGGAVTGGKLVTGNSGADLSQTIDVTTDKFVSVQHASTPTYLLQDPNNAFKFAVKTTTVVVPGDNGGEIVRSTDSGANWTLISGIAAMTSAPSEIATDGTTFVAVTENSGGEMAYSTDGSTWTAITFAGTRRMYSVCYDADNSVFVAVGGDASNCDVYYSANGQTSWTAATTVGNDRRYERVTYSSAEGGVIALDGSQDAWISIDGGDTWTQIFSGTYGDPNTLVSDDTYTYYMDSGSNIYRINDTLDGQTLVLNFSGYAQVNDGPHLVVANSKLYAFWMTQYPYNEQDNKVIYIESSDNGATWTTAGNEIYTPLADYKVFHHNGRWFAPRFDDMLYSFPTNFLGGGTSHGGGYVINLDNVPTGGTGMVEFEIHTADQGQCDYVVCDTNGNFIAKVGSNKYFRFMYFEADDEWVVLDRSITGF